MTPGELVRLVASALDVPETVVGQHDRRLAEEGFRTKGGRGASAPQVIIDDAAKLIIATLAGERFSQTFATVRDLWQAQCSSVAELKGRDSLEHGLALRTQIKFTLGEFEKAISTQCSFGDALIALLKDCISGQMDALLRHGDLNPRQRFQLRVKRPSAEASFSFRHPTEAIAADVEFDFLGATDSDINREIVTTHEISIIPLLRIAAQFRA